MKQDPVKLLARNLRDGQEYTEDYIQKYLPRNCVVYHWFDVYDLEEERL